MKKFFALLVVVMLLAFAGSAFAAQSNSTTGHYEWSIGENGTTVRRSITAGQSSNVPLDLTYDGNVAALNFAITGTAAEWVKVADNKKSLTVEVPAGTAAGTYQAVVTITDTADTSEPKSTQIVTLSITVTANKPTTPVVVIVIEEKEPEEVKVTKNVIASEAQKSVSVSTFADLIKTVAEVITSVIADVEGYDDTLTQVWTAKAADVQQAAEEAVNTPAKREALFPGVDIAKTEPQTNDKLQPAKSSVAENATTDQRLAAAAKDLASGDVALSAGDPVQPTETGTYKFPKTFGSHLFGKKINGHNGARGYLKQASDTLYASEADSTGVAFVNSKGDSVDVIPDDSQSQDIMPGYVNMLVVMEAGEVYEPVVYMTSADAKAANLQGAAVETTVTEYQDTEEKAVIVDPTDPTNTVDAGLLDAELSNVNETLGGTYENVPVTSYITTEAASTTADETYMSNANVQPAAWILRVQNLEDGAYVTKIETFNTTLASGKVLSPDKTPFEFYSNGRSDASATAEGTAGTDYFVLNADGSKILTPKELLSDKPTSGFFAFHISGGAVKASDYSMTKPVLTFNVADEPVEPVPPTPTAATGPGDSSGGCNAGFAGLALAVLGTFIATRKK